MDSELQNIDAVADDVDTLARHVAGVLRAAVAGDSESASQDFEHLLERTAHLVAQKQALEGTKSDTRDLIAELAFVQVRKAFRTLLGQGAADRDAVKLSEWVLGSVLAGSAVVDLASAVDASILASTGPRDFSFAGRTDFIAVEEVLQMIGSGRHTGRLQLEKPDNRIDLYVRHGRIAFLDPHRLSRRVFPRGPLGGLHAIPEEVLEQADRCRVTDGTPLVVSLWQQGELGRDDPRGVMRRLGFEVLFDFLRDEGDARFAYERLDALPDFAVEHDLGLGITPVLLELSRQLDDWRSLSRVFPDAHAPIETAPDLMKRIAHLVLGALEIQVLSLLGGSTSPHEIAVTTGLPLFEVYGTLVRFAQAGALVPAGGPDSLADLMQDAGDALQDAFDALDANDDGVAVHSALDRILGDGS
ncbi:MAG: DUF4388 domain-containing protein [Planctomycetota bacterium]